MKEENRTSQAGLKRYVEFLETLPDAAVLADGSGRVLFANGRVRQLFGYEAGDLDGRPASKLVAERSAAEMVRRVTNPPSGTGRSTQTEDTRLTLIAVRADGTRFPVDATLSCVRLGRRRATVIILRSAVGDPTSPDAALETVAMLEDTLERTIEALARTVELRDRITAGHTRRVTDMTMRIARRLDVPEEELMHIRRGSMLHDVGKILVPDAVLQKPGPLTADERAVMKRHVEYAYEILGSIDALRPALEIPTYHHERWDGSGYGRGLAGPAIPLSARIFAVADAYDAMTSERPYERGKSASQALNYITGRSGTEFDPQVVDAMVTLAAEGGL